MPKKFTVKGKVIEETKYYKAVKPEDETDEFIYVFSKFDDTLFVCRTYKIIGAAILDVNKFGTKQYTNYIKDQNIGQGKSRYNKIEIQSWSTTIVDGKEQTSIIYFNEKGHKFVRYIDEDGNIYKKSKKTQLSEQEETIAL